MRLCTSLPSRQPRSRRRLQNRSVPEGCAKHICGTRAPEPLFGSMDRTRLKDRGGSTGSTNAHLRTPGPSPHRRSGRTKKADRADHGIRSRANTRHARTGALICPGRSHCRFGNKGAKGRANVLLGRADDQFSRLAALLFQID